MPRLPSYEQQVSVNPAEQAPVDVSNYTAGGKLFSETAKNLDEITQKFKEVRDTREVTKASNDFQIELAQIENQADNDPNPDNLPEYQKKIDESMAKHTGTISDPLIKEKAQETFRLKGYSTYSDIGNTKRKRSVELAQNEAIKKIDLNKQDFLKELDPAKQSLIVKDTNDLIDSLVKSGTWTAESANAARNKINREWAVDRVMFDASAPGMAAVVLDKIDSNGYPELSDPTQRKATRDLLESMKIKQRREEEYTTTKIQNARGLDLIKKAKNKELTINEVNELEALGDVGSPDGINSKIAEDLRRMLTKGIGPMAERRAKYADLSTELEDMEKKPEVSPKEITALNEKILSSGIDPDDAEGLLMNLEEITDKSFEKKATSDILNEKVWWSRIFGAKAADVKERKGQYLQAFYKAINEGKTPNEAGKSASLSVDASINVFYKAFIGKKPGDEVVLPNGAKVIFNGVNDSGEVDITPSGAK